MILACEIYNNFSHIDEVWMVPCGDGRKDKTNRSNIFHRIKMLECIKNDLIYEDLPVYIDLTEYNNKKYMPTIQLFDKLSKDHPTYKFSFCLGSDLIKSLHRWEEGLRIINEFELIVLKRPGYDLSGVSYIDKCKILETNFDGSSTQIRNRIDDVIKTKSKIHLGIAGLTTRSVLKYIYENSLYLVESNICDVNIDDYYKEY